MELLEHELLQGREDVLSIPPVIEEITRRSAIEDVYVTFPNGLRALLITRYSDGEAVLRDDHNFSSNLAPFGHLTGVLPVVNGSLPGSIITSDGSEHQRLRKSVMKEFTARAVKVSTETLYSTAEHLIDAAKERGQGGDYVQDFAKPFPALVMGGILGLKEETITQLSVYANTVNDTSASVQDRAAADSLIHSYFCEEFARATRGESDGVLGRLNSLVKLKQLTEREAATLSATLLVAGVETTVQAIGLAALAVLCLDGGLEAVRLDADSVVEELLRQQSIVHRGIIRTCVREATIGRARIVPGTPVVISIACANHGLSDDGTLIDFARKSRHLSFGSGPHQCLGQNLARAEMRVALTCLATLLPNVRLAVEISELALETSLTVVGLKSLPLAWN